LPDPALEARVILMGAPGSGKGTQARLLQRRFGLVVVSAGELVRVVSRQDTPLGRVVARRVASGALLPDQLVVELVRDRLERFRRSNVGFVLDGFPRTISQLAFLERVFSRATIGTAVLLRVDADELLRRLRGRGRSDDGDAAIEQRLRAFERDTVPVLDELRMRGRLSTIDGTGEVEQIHTAITDTLASALSRSPEMGSAERSLVVSARSSTWSEPKPSVA
jgi:adenylate kinase